MTFAKRVFTWAGIYGLIVLTPLYFLEERIGLDQPPAITHPEYYYGFVGVALAWQVLFLILGRDPVRYRPLMIPCILEKLGYGPATIILFAMQRVGPSTLATGLVDLVLGTLFFVAYVKTRP